MARIPDRVGILRFRHLLEEHQLAPQILAVVNATLADRGLMLKQGTAVDATLIAAPSSTKNQGGERDPEMHQTKKGKQWHFGMKAHIGVDADSGLVRAVVGTPANVNDVTQASGLVHGEETDVFADAGYQGVSKREEVQDIDVNWHVALRPGKRRALDKTGPMSALLDRLEHLKASIRAKVEVTTDSNHDLPISPNVLNRAFTVAAPDQVWVGDITYIVTHEGWLFLAAMIDLFNRQVVGWSMRENMTRDIVMDALRMAWFRRRQSAQSGLIFHSDRSSQYASDDFRKLLKGYGITSSMSRRGDCWDTQSTIGPSAASGLTRAGIGGMPLH